MSYTPLFAEISTAGYTIRLDDTRPSEGYAISSKGVAGWVSSPQSKVDLTERGQGNGAFPAPQDGIIYAARTVTAYIIVLGSTREDVLAKIQALEKTIGHHDVKLRVVDATSDTYVIGHTEISVPGEWHERSITAELTLVCPDPRRYGSMAKVATMAPPATGGTGGLTYSQDGVLLWPLDWGAQAEASSICTLTNGGTATAYPVITVAGDMPGGFTVTDIASGRQLTYAYPVTQQGVRLDCLARTASVAGVDMTRHLSARNFPTIASGGSLTLALMAQGTGQATVEARDTYI